MLKQAQCNVVNPRTGQPYTMDGTFAGMHLLESMLERVGSDKRVHDPAAKETLIGRTVSFLTGEEESCYECTSGPARNVGTNGTCLVYRSLTLVNAVYLLSICLSASNCFASYATVLIAPSFTRTPEFTIKSRVNDENVGKQNAGKMSAVLVRGVSKRRP
jgi:hypothetical protein